MPDQRCTRKYGQGKGRRRRRLVKDNTRGARFSQTRPGGTVKAFMAEKKTGAKAKNARRYSRGGESQLGGPWGRRACQRRSTSRGAPGIPGIRQPRKNNIGLLDVATKGKESTGPDLLRGKSEGREGHDRQAATWARWYQEHQKGMTRADESPKGEEMMCGGKRHCSCRNCQPTSCVETGVAVELGDTLASSRELNHTRTVKL